MERSILGKKLMDLFLGKCWKSQSWGGEATMYFWAFLSPQDTQPFSTFQLSNIFLSKFMDIYYTFSPEERGINSFLPYSLISSFIGSYARQLLHCLSNETGSITLFLRSYVSVSSIIVRCILSYGYFGNTSKSFFFRNHFISHGLAKY